MKLLTKELKQRIPLIYSQEEVEDPTVHAKFFTPDACWTWFVLEGIGLDAGTDEEKQLADMTDGDDALFFGFVRGQVGEFGYFRLSQLREVSGPLGLSIERDRHFEAKPLSEARAALRGRRK